MTSWKQVLLVGALVSLSVTAGLAIIILLFGDFGDAEWRILGTTIAISIASLLALPGAILLERGTSTLIGGPCVTLAFASFAWALLVIWGDSSETSVKLLGALAAWAAAWTQLSALETRRGDDDPLAAEAAVVGASGLALLLAGLVSYAIWTEPDSSTFYRVLGALAVLDVALVVMQPILRRLRAGGEATVRAILEGTPDQIDDALRRVEGTGVTVRR